MLSSLLNFAFTILAIEVSEEGVGIHGLFFLVIVDAKNVQGGFVYDFEESNPHLG